MVREEITWSVLDCTCSSIALFGSSMVELRYGLVDFQNSILVHVVTGIWQGSEYLKSTQSFYTWWNSTEGEGGWTSNVTPSNTLDFLQKSTPIHPRSKNPKRQTQSYAQDFIMYFMHPTQLFKACNLPRI